MSHQGDEEPEGSDLLQDVQNILSLVRKNLGMEVAFVSQFVGERRVLRFVDASAGETLIRVGHSDPLTESYCQRVVDGRLPELIPDTSANAEAASLSATDAIPVGAHLSVPLRLSDGSVFGTFCCFNHSPDPSLGRRDLSMLRTFAEIAGHQIERDIKSQKARAEKATRISAVLNGGGPAVVYQPIFLIDRPQPVAAEAFARFSHEPRRPPDEWFSEAGQVGLQTELEFAAIRNALAGYREIWRHHPVQLGVNASAETIMHRKFATLFEDYPTNRVVIELTEHERIRDYAPLIAELSCLRSKGMKIAVDDVGAGYASMRHILAIRPNIMKLDLSIVRSIDTDAMKLALATSLVSFANQFDCKVVAEGVETQAELNKLRGLQVQAVQGYLLGRPEPVSALLARLNDT